MPIVGKILRGLHRPLGVGLATVQVHHLCSFWRSSFTYLQTCSAQCCFCSHSFADFLKDQTIRLWCSWCGGLRYADACFKLLQKHFYSDNFHFFKNITFYMPMDMICELIFSLLFDLNSFLYHFFFFFPTFWYLAASALCRKGNAWELNFSYQVREQSLIFGSAWLKCDSLILLLIIFYFF